MSFLFFIIPVQNTCLRTMFVETQIPWLILLKVHLFLICMKKGADLSTEVKHHLCVASLPQRERDVAPL